MELSTTANWLPCTCGTYGIVISNFIVSEHLSKSTASNPESSTTSKDTGTTTTAPPSEPADPDSINNTTSDPNEKVEPKVRINVDEIKDACTDLIIGDIVQILETHPSGWARGYVFTAGEPLSKPPLGIFPYDFVQLCPFPTFEKLLEKLNSLILYDLPLEPITSLPKNLSQPNLPPPEEDLERKASISSKDLKTPLGSHYDLNQFISHYYHSTPVMNEENDYNSSKPFLPPPRYPCLEKTPGHLGYLLDASAAALRDWYCILCQSLKNQNYTLMQTVKKHFSLLFELRKTLITKNEMYLQPKSNDASSSFTPVSETSSTLGLQKNTIKAIEEGNHALSLNQMLYNEDGSIVTNQSTSLLQMKEMYLQLDARLGTEASESSSSTRSKPATETESSVYHIFLDVKPNVLSLSFPHYSTEYRFSIYSKRSNSFITDDHVVIVDEQTNSDPHSPTLDGLKCIFTDFSAEEVANKLFLVCRVVRFGPLKESEANSKINCRRAVAIGFIEINEIFSIKEVSNSLSFQLRLFEHGNDQGFSNLLSDLMNKSNSCIPLKCEPLSLALRYYTELPSTLPQTSSMNLVDRTSISEPLNPFLRRNSIYVTLESGEFLKALGKTFEVSLQLRNETNEPIFPTFPIYKGQLSPSEYFFTTFYHNFNPKYNETVRIELPTKYNSNDPKFYLFFLVRSCSRSAIDKNDRKVAMGFMPLFDANKAVIGSDPISLPLYRYDKKLETSYTADHPDLAKLLVKDILNFSISLVSTVHTQSTALVQFLCPDKLVKLSNKGRETYLQALKTVESFELIKFSLPLIDTLMMLICEDPLNVPKDISTLVLDNILNLYLHIYNDRDPRFHLYRQVLQSHIETTFNKEAAYYNLILALQRLIQDVRENAKDIESIRKLQSTFKFLTHAFRIFVKCGSLLKANDSTLPKENEPLFTWNSFIKTLSGFLNSITSLMTDTAEHLTAIQQLAFVNFSHAFPILKESYDIDDLVDRIISFTEASSSQRGSTVQKKLSFVLAMVKSDLVNQHIDAFFKLSKAVLRWVGDYIGWWDPTATDTTLRAQVCNECVSILCELLNKLHSFHRHSDHPQFGSLVLKITEMLPSLYIVYKDFLANPNVAQGLPQRPSSIFLTSAATDPGPNTAMFPTLSHLESTSSLSTVPRGSAIPRPGSGIFVASSAPATPILPKQEYPSSNPDKTNVNAMLVATLNLLSFEQLAQQCQTFFSEQGEKRGTQWILQLCSLVDMLYGGGNLLSTCLNYNFATVQNLVKFFHALHAILKTQFSSTSSPTTSLTQSTDYELKYMILRTFLCILNSDFLQSEWKSQTWMCGFQFDILTLLSQSGQLLVALWETIRLSFVQLPLSPNQDSNFTHVMITSLLSFIMELSMSPHASLNEAAFRMLFSMIQAEFQTEGSINQLEFLCMDCLDHLILNLNKGDHTYRQKLMQSIHSFKKRFSATISEPLKQAIDSFMNNLNVFLTLLITLSELPRSLEYEDEQSNSIYKLAKFMKQIGRTDYFLKYIHYLAKKQVTAQNLVEAGWTLKLHSDMLQWTDTLLPPIPDLGFESSQKECQRKEQLLLDIVSYFEEGKAWESAIEACKELSYYYEEVICDYVKHSENLQTMSRLYGLIGKEERYYSEYFRVGYYGMGFPPSLRNKQFVYRGHEWEKIGPFCERIQSKHADSALLKSNAPPGPEILNSDMRYLQITAVQPEPDLSLPIFQKGDIVPESVRKYYEANHINKFSVSRPFRRGNKTDNEFLCLWTEKITYVTEDIFPHLLRRSEVIECTTVEYSPIENAVQAMIMKNKDLLALEKKYEKFTEPQQNCNPLTMCINGAVDAPVNGGVPMYKKAFIKSDYGEENPDKKEWVKKLEDLIDEQVIILDRCLSIHNRIVPTQMRPLHETIVSFFYKNFVEEIERLGIKPQAQEATTSNTPSSSSSDSEATFYSYMPTKKEERFSRGHHWSKLPQLSHPKVSREKNRSVNPDDLQALSHAASVASNNSLNLKRASDFLGKIRGPTEGKGGATP